MSTTSARLDSIPEAQKLCDGGERFFNCRVFVLPPMV